MIAPDHEPNDSKPSCANGANHTWHLDEVFVTRRERAMHRFRSSMTLQKSTSIHAHVHNQFNQERHLVTRQVYMQRRSAALAGWRALAVVDRRSRSGGRPAYRRASVTLAPPD